MKFPKASKTDPQALQNARNLRSNQTPAETKLWAALRSRQLEGIKFRRQVPIGNYIVDFYCHSARLAVEIDGDTHAGREAYDQQRTHWLNDQGVRVIRFTNRDVHEYLNDVIVQIIEACKEDTKPGGNSSAS